MSQGEKVKLVNEILAFESNYDNNSVSTDNLKTYVENKKQLAKLIYKTTPKIQDNNFENDNDAVFIREDLTMYEFLRFINIYIPGITNISQLTIENINEIKGKVNKSPNKIQPYFNRLETTFKSIQHVNKHIGNNKGYKFFIKDDPEKNKYQDIVFKRIKKTVFKDPQFKPPYHTNTKIETIENILAKIKGEPLPITSEHVLLELGPESATPLNPGWLASSSANTEQIPPVVTAYNIPQTHALVDPARAGGHPLPQKQPLDRNLPFYQNLARARGIPWQGVRKADLIKSLKKHQIIKSSNHKQ